jgi:hypothetical protein
MTQNEMQLTPMQLVFREQALNLTVQQKVSEGTKLKEGDTKRLARNVREQRRTHRLSEQIDTIKNLLEEAQFPLKSSSKFHILYACEQYIAQLHGKEEALRKEKRTWDQLAMEPHSEDEWKSAGDGSGEVSSRQAKKRPRDSARATQGSSDANINWRHAVMTAATPLAIAKLDCQIVAWNQMFERVVGFPKEQMNTLTIFSLVHPADLQKMFIAVADCMQRKSGVSRPMRAIIRPPTACVSADQASMNASSCKSMSDRNGPWEISVTAVRDETETLRCLQCVLLEATASVKPTDDAAHEEHTEDIAIHQM